MLDKFLAFLRELGYPVRLHGYLLDTDLDKEDAVLTYEEISTQSVMEYSNSTNGILWTWRVHIIARDPATAINISQKLRKLSLTTPFTPQGFGSGYPIQGTGYYGRSIDIKALEILKN